jgi:hypothetical protein
MRRALRRLLAFFRIVAGEPATRSRERSVRLAAGASAGAMLDTLG